MGSLIDELQRREAAARQEAEELRGQIAELAERLAQVEERLSRLVVAREVVGEVLDGADAEVSLTAVPEGVTGSAGSGRPPVTGAVAVPPWRPGLDRDRGEPVTGPWAGERAALAAGPRHRVVAAAHLLRYLGDERVGESFRGTGEIICLAPGSRAFPAPPRRRLRAWP